MNISSQNFPKITPARLSPVFRAAVQALPSKAPESMDNVVLRTLEGHDDVPRLAPETEVEVSRSQFTESFIDKITERMGEGGLTLLAAPRKRTGLSHHVAEAMRLSEGNGLVLDPAELNVSGWESTDYADHWVDVQEAFADDMRMVLAPGWSESDEVKASASHAQALGIPTLKLERIALDRMDIELRLAESEEELRQRGFEAPNFVETLNGAVDQDYLNDTATADFTTEQQLKDPVAYVSDVVARTLNGHDDVDNDGAKQAGKLPRAEFTKLYVEAALQQLNGQPMVYVSTPITGGSKKYDLLDQLGIKDKSEFDQSDKKRFVKDVIVANTNRAYRISESVRAQQTYGMTMDPSEITIPEWSQAHYAAHWDAVVEKLASKIVLAPGWDFSTGCILELKRGLDKGVPIEEVALVPLSMADRQSLE
jgi:hypothetical protein